MSVTHGGVAVVARADGRHTVTGQGHLRLPAHVRHRYQLHAGDRLLVAAHPDTDLVLVYPTAVLDDMLLAHHGAAGRSAP